MEKKVAVVAFGRFQPPTTGHEKMIRHVAGLAHRLGGDAHVFPSPSHGDGNPLEHSKKVGYLKSMFPYVNVSHDKKIASPFHAMKHLSDKGYTHVHLVAGGDRVSEYEGAIRKYIKHPDPKKSFNFDHFEVVNAGHRDPKASGVTGMSGTKMRHAVSTGDYKTFKSGLPSRADGKTARSLWHDLRRNT